MNVILDLDGAPEDAVALGDGYRVEARIVTAERPHVLLVPESAIFRRGDGRAVFVVSDGVAKLRTVTVGEGDGLRAEVLGGLAANDEVIVHPSDLLEDGMKVAPRATARR